jgi:hypothetical protein
MFLIAYDQISKKYIKIYHLVFPHENSNMYLHAFWDLITSLLNPWESDQYSNNDQFFNSWELIVNIVV